MPRKVRKSLKHGNSSNKTKILKVFLISRYAHDGISSNTAQDKWGRKKYSVVERCLFLSIPSVQVRIFDTKDWLCAKFLT